MTDVILVKFTDIKVKDVVPTIEKYQAMMPNYEIFCDGDLRAIVGRCRE